MTVAFTKIQTMLSSIHFNFNLCLSLQWQNLKSSPLYQSVSGFYPWRMSWAETGTANPPARLTASAWLPAPARGRVDCWAGVAGRVRMLLVVLHIWRITRTSWSWSSWWCPCRDPSPAKWNGPLRIQYIRKVPDRGRVDYWVGWQEE